jgi:hypothetical protein
MFPEIGQAKDTVDALKGSVERYRRLEIGLDEFDRGIFGLELLCRGG